MRAEVPSPEGVNWGHLSLFKYKFAEVHSPEGVKGDVLVVFELKKGLFLFRHRDYAWSVNRGREACDTRTNHGSLGYHGGRGDCWSVQAQSARS